MVSSTCGLGRGPDLVVELDRKAEVGEGKAAHFQGTVTRVTKPSLWALGSHPRHLRDGAWPELRGENTGKEYEFSVRKQYAKDTQKEQLAFQRHKFTDTLEWRLVSVEAEAAAWADGPRAQSPANWPEKNRNSKKEQKSRWGECYSWWLADIHWAFSIFHALCLELHELTHLTLLTLRRRVLFLLFHVLHQHAETRGELGLICRGQAWAGWSLDVGSLTPGSMILATKPNE